MTKNDTATFVVKELLNAGTLHSCLNCENWLVLSGKCEKFGATPPAEVIVFSCGNDWEFNIPF